MEIFIWKLKSSREDDRNQILILMEVHVGSHLPKLIQWNSVRKPGRNTDRRQVNEFQRPSWCWATVWIVLIRSKGLINRKDMKQAVMIDPAQVYQPQLKFTTNYLNLPSLFRHYFWFSFGNAKEKAHRRTTLFIIIYFHMIRWCKWYLDFREMCGDDCICILCATLPSQHNRRLNRKLVVISRLRKCNGECAV